MRTVTAGFTASRAVSFHGKTRVVLGGALDKRREMRPGDDLRVGRFGWRKGAGLRYYDENGDRISKEDWLELGRHRAEKESEGKGIEDEAGRDGQAGR